MMKLILGAAAVAAILGLPTVPALAQSTPSAATARAVFEGRLRRNLGGVPYVIQSFRKTDGQSVNFGGVAMYRFFYQAAVSFPKGYRPECVSRGNRFPGFDCALKFGTGRGGVRPQLVGAVAPFSGELTFERRESGWVAR